MIEKIKKLCGSVKRDLFKLAHKNKMPHGESFYASDADLCLICTKPRGVVAYLDYKGSGEEVTFTEKILYDEWTATKPVYIVEGANPEDGPFQIYRYLTGGNLEFVCTVSNWIDYEKWEASVRRDYTKG